MAEAEIYRQPKSLQDFVDTIEMVEINGSQILQTTIPCIKKYKQRLLGEDLSNMVKNPMKFQSQSINDILVESLVELCKVKPVGIDAVQWLGEYLLANNPNKPIVEDPIDVE